MRATTNCLVDCAGESIELRPERAAWWPARRTLLVADLHLGKEEAFLRFGVPMPSNVLDETLGRLDSLSAALGAERIVVVGDLVHSRHGLSATVVAAVAAWRDRFAGLVELAVGNHDRRVDLPEAWRIRRRAADEPDGPFRYVHDPADIAATRDGFVWCGHLHPTVRLSSAFDRLVLPCFLVSGRRAILPAFTAFARGPGVRPEADDRVFASAAGEVIEVRGG